MNHSNSNITEQLRSSFAVFLPELIFGLTVLSYFVVRYSAKLIETFTDPVTVSSVVFVSLKFQKRRDKNYFIIIY